MSHNLSKKLLISFLLVIMTFFACKKAIDEPDTNIDIQNEVNVDLALVPYSKLSDYKFFKGELKNQEPNSDVIPYQPASSLFTDYAKKKRFIWLPKGTKGSYVSDHELIDLPIGAVLIKTFYYDSVQPLNNTKIIETRLMIKKSTGWIFAEYVWNEDQTEAYLQMDGSYTNVSFLQNGETKSTNYRIPSETECLICHKKNSQAVPIGIKPQNLNTDYSFPTGIQNQLQKWVSLGILENNIPGSIVSTVDYNDETYPLRLRLRSYLDINCAHCHRENSHCDYRPLRLAFNETDESVNMGICVPPDEVVNPTLVEIIVPGNINKSMMHFRLNSTEAGNRMPLLGRTLVHEEGVNLLRQFILSINNCD
jgi:uncharacterized repeat protein (TIGR03806 family)